MYSNSNNNSPRSGQLRVCVFGSSSKNTNPRYVAESVKLGEALAKEGHLCVNGAGSSGCMGGVNKGVQTYGGKVLGVIHEKFCVDFGEHPHISDLIMSKGSDLSERKQALLDNSDCIMVLPGGVGTFDEFWDAICGKSLGMKGLERKPFVLVNLDGFYDGFILQMKRASKDGILYGKPETYFHVESDALSALEYCKRTIKEDSEKAHCDTLINNIKENNQEEGRVKERLPKATTEIIAEKVTAAEEYVVEKVLDYQSIGTAFIFGAVTMVMVQKLLSQSVL